MYKCVSEYKQIVVSCFVIDMVVTSSLVPRCALVVRGKPETVCHLMHESGQGRVQALTSKETVVATFADN